jgi:hypothetical protein
MPTDRSPIQSADDLAREQEARAAAQREEHALRLRFESDMKWLMADKRGRRVMFDLLSRAGIYTSSFTGNSETFFREGRRSIGLEYLKEVESLAFDGFVKMLQERST